MEEESEELKGVMNSSARDSEQDVAQQVVVLGCGCTCHTNALSRGNGNTSKCTPPQSQRRAREERKQGIKTRSSDARVHLLSSWREPQVDGAATGAQGSGAVSAPSHLRAVTPGRAPVSHSYRYDPPPLHHHYPNTLLSLAHHPGVAGPAE